MLIETFFEAILYNYKQGHSSLRGKQHKHTPYDNHDQQLWGQRQGREILIYTNQLSILKMIQPKASIGFNTIEGAPQDEFNQKIRRYT